VKKGIFFQIIILIILLATWNLLHIGYNHQKKVLEANISELPMLIFSTDVILLDSLAKELDDLSYIRNITIEADSIIAEKLISGYGLDNAKDILSSYRLPSLMNISFDGTAFQTPQKEELKKILTSSGYTELTINYDSDLWQLNRDKLKLLTKIFYGGNALILVLFLLISVFLRIHFEIKSNDFWQIFRSSGGNRKVRRKQFLLNSLWLCFVPLLLATGLYFAAMYFKYINIQIDYRLFGVEFAAIIISILMSRIFLGKNI
jgi:hypothetical protein